MLYCLIEVAVIKASNEVTGFLDPVKSIFIKERINKKNNNLFRTNKNT